MRNKKLKWKIYLLFFLILLLSVFKVSSSYAFLADEVAASVNDTPITLNYLYFLYNFRKINSGRYSDIKTVPPQSELKRMLDFSINRMLILDRERKIGSIKINAAEINAFIKNFQGKFISLHKHMDFKDFLKRFGYNERSFRLFAKDILIEKAYISNRLQIFLYIMQNSPASGGNKAKDAKEFKAGVDKMLDRLKSDSKININDGY